MQAEALKKQDVQRGARASHLTAVSDSVRPEANAAAGDGASPVEQPAAEPSARKALQEVLVTEKPAGFSRRKPALIGLAAVLLLGAAGWFGYDYMTAGRFMVS